MNLGCLYIGSGGQGLSQWQGVRPPGAGFSSSHGMQGRLVMPLGCCWDPSLGKQFGKFAENHRKDVTLHGWLVLLRGIERWKMENAFCTRCQLPVMVQQEGRKVTRKCQGMEERDLGSRLGLGTHLPDNLVQDTSTFWDSVFSPVKGTMSEC